MFVDQVKIYAKAGTGGHGCISFLREKYNAFGGPNGGDGGNGGSITLRACASQSSLVDLKYQQHVKAPSGGTGMGKGQHGANAEDLIVLVPLGTMVMDWENDYILLADLDKQDDEILICQGGKGGRGNIRFATSTNRAPRMADSGGLGEERILFLELKIIADVGLVGYPNAGKSTFLDATTQAAPITAPYPFTTLNPIVGIVDFEDYTRMTIADIPGLIEGASENVGLGHNFLRHVERTKVLTYVLDIAGLDARDPLEDFVSLQKELDLYQEGLAARGAVIFANKMDEPGAEENLERLRKVTDLPIFPMSGALDQGTDEAIAFLRTQVEAARALQAETPTLKNVHQMAGDSILVDLDESGDFF